MFDDVLISDRLCDALNELTPHQKLRTIRGDYWICSVTGQFSFDGALVDAELRYDQLWQAKISQIPESARQKAEHARWLGRVEPYRKTGQLFEVGAGSGTFLRDAIAAGWHAHGNDLSKVAIEQAHKTSGVEVIHGPIEQIDLDRRCYDVILCNNVFEHLQQPRMALCKMAAALRPGGVLFLQTLSAQSLSLWFQPTGWLHYSPGHLLVPTLVSLAHYFERARLAPTRFETHGFRSAASEVARQTRQRRKLFDKLMSLLAARINLGHRVKYLLENRNSSEQ